MPKLRLKRTSQPVAVARERASLRPLARRPAPRQAPQQPTQRITRPDYFGAAKPDILFVVDPYVAKVDDEEPPEPSAPLTKRQLEFLSNYCKKYELPLSKCAITWAVPPLMSEQWDSDKKLTDALKGHHNEFLDIVTKAKPRVIVACGKAAARQVLNRAVAITKIRGTPQRNEEYDCLVFPMLGLAHTIKIPDVEPTFDADMATLGKIHASGYKLKYQSEVKQDYRWITDLQFLLDNPPEYLSVDIEGVGLRWYEPKSRILTVQLCTGPGVAYAVPINYNHVRGPGAPIDNVLKAKLVRQLKQLLENPKVKCFGQNFKFDFMMLRAKLGITVATYEDDTILLSHAVDENLKQRSLDEITRLYVPALSGYADEFNRDPIHQKKSRMDLVPPDKMLMYGCGDTDAAWRNRDVLLERLKQDKKAYHCYRTVVMPAMRAFCDVEVHGIPVSLPALRRFEVELRKHQQAEYKRILKMVPPVIRNEYILKDKKWKGSITRREFLLQMLFTHPAGLRLTPKQFTKGTKNLKDKTARVPSVSSKDHLPYFEDKPFVAEIMKYIKNEKLLGTYVGTEGDGEDEGSVKGFYKYTVDGLIRPSYLLHGTTTGRSSTKDPNGQNFPKHGEMAKRYREIFVAPPGKVLIEVDFSQLELRIAAILANEPTMMRLYREGADIHAMTAAAVMGITLEAFLALDPDTKAQKRFEAKAVNFGFLYGMGWRKFIVYAKTTYGVEFNDEEAQEIRQTFFRLYRNLKPWHEATRAFVKEHKYVRALDGRMRHLPSVGSPDEMVAQGAERQAINSPVQGFGSDLGLMALQLIHKNVDPKLVQPIGFIHDALVCIADEDKAKEAAATIKYWMEHIPLKKWFNFQPPIPIVAEASVGKNLSKMIEIKDKWFSDNDTKTYYDLQMLAWKADCEKAIAKGKQPPAQPQPGSAPRRRLTLRMNIKPQGQRPRLRLISR